MAQLGKKCVTDFFANLPNKKSYKSTYWEKRCGSRLRELHHYNKSKRHAKLRCSVLMG